MRKRKFIRKNLILLIFILWVTALPGCSNRQADPKDGITESRTEADGAQEDNGNGDNALQPESEEAERKLWTEDERGCMILEDENYIYVCSTCRLAKINKDSKKEEILWENSDALKDQKTSLYLQGEGLLLHEKIYFIEAQEEEDGTVSKALSVINTDGSDYRKIGQIQGYSSNSMTVIDGILYVDMLDIGAEKEYSPLCYQVYEDGTLSEMKSAESREIMPEGYHQEDYVNNGDRVLFVTESEKNFGYLLLRNKDYKLVKVDPETGKETPLSAEIPGFDAYNDQYFLSNVSEKLYLVKKETLAVSELAEYDSTVYVIFMDEDFVYVEYTAEGSNGEGEYQHVYEKVNLDTGDRSVIFRQNKMLGIGNYYEPGELSDIVVKNGYLYYTGADDYKLYLMRRSLEDPSKEEILGEAFYDSGIGKVGTIRSYHEKNYSRSDPDFILTETDLAWLQVDERFAGAEEINRYLTEDQNKNIEYENSNVELLEKLPEENPGSYGMHCSFTSVISEIAYFDEHYLSFCQQEYDYMGGAHGMPLWNGMTFDLETGQRLSLKDVVGNSEEELKDIVTEYFAEYINRNPEEFWADAIDTVREETDFDSDFYLTGEGIKFYFHPYALASYAAWFQEVIIPYEEFEMKIPVSGILCTL